MDILLSGIIGSTAYGLAGPESDIDRLVIFVHPTQKFHGLHLPSETNVTTNPDKTLHEVGKYCRLALSCNPTVSELMWLPEYEIRTDLGNELISIRESFLSRNRVRDAYLGYATSQFKRLEYRGDGSFSADTRNRTAKHARHLMRLCHQGYQLYVTGELEIKLGEPQKFVDFGENVAEGDIELAQEMLESYEAGFDAADTVLPDKPDEDVVERWL